MWGAAISRFASLFDSLSSTFFDDPVFAGIRARDLGDAQQRNPANNPVYFTDAFFHRPEELSQEFRSAGFRAPGLLAIEGPGGLARDFERLWSNPKQRERLLDAVRKVESEQAVLLASSQIMAIASK